MWVSFSSKLCYFYDPPNETKNDYSLNRLNFTGLIIKRGHAVALQAGRSWVRFSMVSLEFFIDIILPAAIWLWGRLSL